MSAHPFSTLTPDRVLDAIDATGLRTDGRLLALNSYENRVYQAGLEEGGFVVAKFYRPERWSDAAIREEHAFTQLLAEHEIPAVPPMCLPGGDTLAHAGGFRVAVFERRGGRTPELDHPEVLEWLGRFIGRIHAQGATRAYEHRLLLDVANWGDMPGEFVLASPHLPADLREAYRAALTGALDGVRASFERAGEVRQLCLHGDCHPGNVLWTDAGPHFVDFDDSCMGPAVQDLWMLLSGERGEMTRQLCDLVAGYEDFADFNPREVGLIEALRTLRLIHHAAWLARRWEDPAFPVAFPWFNTRGWWEEHIGTLRDQVPRMAEPWLF
ncbi:serine/threonine protein kinase [Uliginosibacterium sp. 31-16]|uniref:serine/threonine protein kinase n=1 Tax=Uliginosibacterium sp. 31-16 TaxID=3068315 RepID=UPI00273D7D36|nr:serine/threonine protein kinase [Uliginosibacterium sp. 31-16]MDP5238111.1 serine/threonine protein kinase [Uliginosibacterium sp. 31-16]